jgi:cellulose biosynthesis protein BcsQ
MWWTFEPVDSTCELGLRVGGKTANHIVESVSNLDRINARSLPRTRGTTPFQESAMKRNCPSLSTLMSSVVLALLLLLLLCPSAVASPSVLGDSSPDGGLTQTLIVSATSIAVVLITSATTLAARRKLHRTKGTLREKEGELHETEGKLRQTEGELHETNEKLVAIEKEKNAAERRKEEQGKRDAEELMAKAQDATLPSSQKWATFFKKDVQFFKEDVSQTAATAKEIAGGTRMIVVASGKGGVGKSMLSLGLMEYYCRTGNVLLVDFDMPNRGLTSLLRPNFPDSGERKLTYLLDEMENFSVLFRDAGTGAAGEAHKNALKLFNYLLDEFTLEQKGENRLTRPLGLFQFHGDDVHANGEILYPENAYFLPSVKPGDLFLSSGVFDASFLEVYYFLKCLACWAQRPNGIGHIIIDCHGAHDLFMVGAIHASTDLIVVTTPDAGSFDGTFDLLAFADKLKSEHPYMTFPSVLVINNCRDWQQSSSDAITTFFNGQNRVKLDGIVGVKADDKIREVAVDYHIGKACQSPIWESVKEIGRCLGAPRDDAENSRPAGRRAPSAETDK